MKKAWNKPQETTITKTTKPFLARPKERSSKKICGNKEARYRGCSTSLELYDNPWKIKKALTTSDLGKLNRLLFGADLLESLMLPVLGAEARRDAENGMGAPIRVWDVDTMSMHQLILKRWASFKSYVLIGKWGKTKNGVSQTDSMSRIPYQVQILSLICKKGSIHIETNNEAINIIYVQKFVQRSFMNL